MIDLQSHSTFSDGELPPAGVVAAAVEAGVTTLALTDHDAIDGVAEAGEAAKEAGIVLVPATEISCVHGSIDDMHMLGYWVDTIAIAPALERAQRERVTRAREIVERLNAQGVPVTFEDAIAQAGDASSVGRPHIAEAAGVKPEGMSAFFEEWLVPGAKAFVSRRWPDAAEATEMIHGAGGSAVLAHPFWDMDDPNDVAALIDDLDIDGVECFYPAHDRAQTKFLLEVCSDRGLSATASSDFHGPSHKMFNSFSAYPTYDLGEPELPPRH
ncbi:MAG: 3,5-nucleoside bisphosphate phosphatase [Solirubrobacterales bacterium]|jgi:predicted metal-dependent phosphoesterase TrpH|nr:3,5-nucleoside bisphosphate phosphatase [Solirubrobacterales bacterium]